MLFVQPFATKIITPWLDVTVYIQPRLLFLNCAIEYQTVSFTVVL